MKTCTKCGIESDNFSKNRTAPDGLQTWCKSCINDQKLVREYGITRGEYDLLLIKQEFGCACCGSTHSKRKGHKRLVVDHDHATGEVRGLLCHPCNVALGLLYDDSQLIRTLADYVDTTSGIRTQDQD